MRFGSVVGAVLVALSALSCSDRTIVAPPGSRLASEPAARAEAPGGFGWLAPLGTAAADPANFDASLSARVVICAWSGTACVGSPVAQLAAAPNATAGQFEVSWSLMSPTFVTRKTYRISALVGSTELGAVLVDVVRGRWALTRTDGTLAPLAAATELPIRFYVPLPAPIKINEVESNGDPSGDWAELYNPTSSPVDISGWVFRDNDPSHGYRVPDGTTIPAGGYFVLAEGAFGFGLGAPDEARITSNLGTLVDRYAWTAHAATTYARCPNGTGDFETSLASTKGAANSCVIPGATVKINEVESNGGTPGDWIELFNTGTTTVDLSGFIVKDNDDAHVSIIPAGTTIAPGAYYIVEEAALGFGLGAADAARLYNKAGTLIDSYTWTAHAATTYARCPNGTGDFITSTTPTKAAANDCGLAGSAVKLNEVDSDPDDWVELLNTGAVAVNLSGFMLKDNDDTHIYTFPAGTSIAPGAFLVVEGAQLGFGLGGADAIRLYNAGGTLTDSFSWSAHAAITYGRCPDGTGAFTSTFGASKGSANICSPPTAPWPGSDDVHTVDGTAVFGGNLSGLTFESGGGLVPSVLWAVRNNTVTNFPPNGSTMYRLVFNGSIWTSDAGDWSIGKLLKYGDNSGNPDAEGVTFAAGGSTGGMYVSTERDNNVSGTSRNSILRFDPLQPGTTLRATHEWNLTSDLPVVGPNLGLEAITWIPDNFLLAMHFFDESKGRAYNPADYPDHGTGLFFVGLEQADQNGKIFGYALNHTTLGFTRVATITTGFPGVMGLEFDRETGYLWATCDDGCQNTTGILEIDPTTGKFGAPRRYARPSTMPNLNNEGFALATSFECVAGLKPVFWSDDSETNGHSIRQASVPCGPFSSPVQQLNAGSRFQQRR